MRRLRIVYAIVSIAVVSACGAGAQKLQVVAPFAAKRSAGSLVLDVTITREDRSRRSGLAPAAPTTDDGILRGRLVATWGADHALPHRWEGPELAIASPVQTVRLMLAPAPRLGKTSWCEVSFHSVRGGVIRVRLAGVPFGSLQRRDVAVGVAFAGVRELDRQLRGALRIEQSLLGSSRVQDDEPLLRADVRQVDPHAFPDDPLALLGFDALVFDEAALAVLGPERLDVLVRWVEAGGSALFTFCSSVLDDEVVPALNRLFAATGLVYSVDGARVLAMTPDGGSHRIGGLRGSGDPAPDYQVSGRAGAGRVSVVHRPADAPPLAPERARAVVRYTLRADTMRRQRPMLPPTSFEPLFDVDLDASDYAPELTPVPLMSVGLLLAFYLLGIGPVDWLVARWVRRAWLNWSLFVGWTAAAVAAVVALAHGHFGGRDADRTVWITDVGSAGRIVRESGVRMLFSSKDRRHEERVRNRLVTPVLLATGVASGRLAAVDEAPIEFHGAFPRNYRMGVRLRQWAPRALRSFEIAPQRDDPIARAIAALPPDTSAADVLSRLAPIVGDRALEVFTDRSRARAPAQPPAGWVAAVVAVQRWSRARRSGTFRGFVAVAPTGGRSLDDLVVEPGAVRLFVVVAVEGGIRVYRRLEPAAR